MERNHYGITVNSDIPVTGVFSMHNLEWICDDMDKGIDEEYEAHVRECPNEEHDDCFGDSDGSGTTLIGFVYNEETKLYDEDPTAEYSAIVSDTYVQVTKSSYGIRCELCSPCYPGQGDGDTEGDYLAYSIPPEVVGEQDAELKARIFELPKVK